VMQQDLTPFDLKIFRFNYFGFSVGAGFNISTPLFKKRYSDISKFRCVSLVVHFFGAQIAVIIPIMEDS